MTSLLWEGTIISAPFSEVLWLYSDFQPPSLGHKEETGNSLVSAQGQRMILHILQAFEMSTDKFNIRCNVDSVEDTGGVIKKKQGGCVSSLEDCCFLIKTALEYRYLFVGLL